MPRSAALLLILAALAQAQTAEPLQIRGTVIEPDAAGPPGTPGLPIGGVEVTLSEFVVVDNLVTRSITATVYTDPRGAFQFHPQHLGDYYIEVKKEGYAGTSPGTTEFTGASAKLDTAHPSLEIPFQLTRRGGVTGRVIDEDGKPVADLKVTVQTPGLTPFHAIAVTAADGTFTASNLFPGPHVVRISPRAGELEKVVPRYSEGDLKIVDQDIETMYWPGGSAEPSTSIPVSPGNIANAGNIQIRRAPYYRVHVSVASANCTPPESWSFGVLDSSGQPLGVLSRGFPELPCISDFLVTNLRPGSYSFVLNQTRTAPGRWAISPVEITSRNIEVTMTMARDAEIVGRMIPAEGVTLPPLNRVHLSSRPDTVGFPRSAPVPPPDAEGKFAIGNLKYSRHQILVDGLGSQNYVKEIRLNGATSPDGFVTLSPGAANQLEIVIDDRAGIITGIVMDGDKPVPGALVGVFTQVPQFQSLDGRLRMLADKDGRFQFAGLAPGEYRVVAVSNVSVWPADAARAEGITVERGSIRNVSIKLTNPSH